jgi:hypothetical protein
MKSPPKREGAMLPAPIPKLDWTETTAARAPLQACKHPVTCTERLPDGSPHYARLTCAICGRFLRWLPKPQTIERQRVNAFRLAKLSMRPDLSDWERSFVRDVSKRRKLSPKQEARILRLVARYLEAKTP